MLVFNHENTIPDGYRKLSKEELLNDYLKLDKNSDCRVSKNEWMLTFINILAKDIEALEAEAPDSLMSRIEELSNEFDRYDTNGNGYLEFKEFQYIVENSVFISD